MVYTIQLADVWYIQIRHTFSLYASRTNTLTLLSLLTLRKVFRIGTVRYNWPMSAHESQAFSIAHCTGLEDLPTLILTPNHKNHGAYTIGSEDKHIV